MRSGRAKMQISPTQHDALVELLNIGFGRAGASLSTLTGQRVLLEVPHVAVHPLEQLNQKLSELVRDEVATVHQVFKGPVSGDALLMLDPTGAAVLKELLTDEPALPLDLDLSAREVLTEVGNVLLNACIGTFGNLLKVPISFSVPDVDVSQLHTILDRLIAEGHGLRYALVITSAFRLRDSEVTGYVVIILTVQSLTRLLISLEAWERSQG
jgi:chemotaxis protein CheC